MAKELMALVGIVATHIQVKLDRWIGVVAVMVGVAEGVLIIMVELVEMGV